MGKKVTQIIFLIALVVVCGCKSSTDEPKTYVVTVGISDYLKIPDLRLPEKDAEAVKDLFSNRKAVVKHLVGLNANKAQIKNALNDVCTKAGKQDRIIFYFSGHGYPGGFCPYDMDDKKIETGLQYDDVFAIFKQSKAEFKMIIADACYSGGIRMSSKEQNKESQTKLTNTNVITFLSSRSNEFSIESPFMPNGIFTTSLVRGLKGGADINRDKQITAKELFDFVSKGVKEKSKDKQHPVMWGKFNNEVVIIDWR